MNWFTKLFKRQAPVRPPADDDPSWQPGDARGTSTFSQIYSPPIIKAIKTYADLLLATPLDCNNETDYLYKKLTTGRICSFMPNNVFWTLLVERYFLNESFVAVIDSDQDGKVRNLLPYGSPQAIQVYTNNQKKHSMLDQEPIGDYSDPILLAERNYFFRDLKSRVFFPDQIFEVRNGLYSNIKNSLIEGEDLMRVFPSVLEALNKLPDALNKMVKRDLRGSVLLSSHGEGDLKARAPEAKKVRQALEKFLYQEDDKGGVLTLPSSWKAEHLNLNDVSGILNQIQTILSENVCDIFGIPKTLIYSQNETVQTLKEARRFFISGSFRSFLKVIENEINRLSETSIYSFSLDKLRTAQQDDRENFHNIPAMLEIWPREEVKKKLETN